MISTPTRESATDFRTAYERRPDSPEWLAGRRRTAWEHFDAHGFPTTRDELWKYTNVTPLTRRRFDFADAAPEVDLEVLRPFLLGESTPRLVFVDGRLAPELSTASGHPGLEVEALPHVLDRDPASLSSTLGAIARPDEGAFQALNTAVFDDGALVRLAPSVAQRDPIHLCFVSATAGVVSHPRILVLAACESRAQIVETHVCLAPGASFTNAVTEIHVGSGAFLDHYKLFENAPHAFHVASAQAHLLHDAHLRSHLFTFGAALMRDEVKVHMAAEGAECELTGLYVADGNEHVDCQTFLDHAVPHSSSAQTYHGVLDGSASGVFNGRVLVREDAQLIEAHQSNKNLLLSPDASVDTKPELVIHADDVKCSHGATIGRLDEDAIFYLRSRGIEEPAARVLLTRAFAAAVTGGIRVEPLRRHLDGILERTFSHNAATADRA